LEAIKDLNDRLDFVESGQQDSNETLAAYTQDIGELKALIIKQTDELKSAPKAKDETGKLRKGVTEFKKKLAGLASLSSEAVIGLYQELQTVRTEVGIEPEATTEDKEGDLFATKVDFSIEAMASANTIEEVESIIEENFGPEHVTHVNHAEFNDKYKKYTPNGYMVFYKRGDHWELLVDENALGKYELVDQIKGQFTHELLHLKFDKSKKVRDEVRNSFIKNGSQWTKIKSAFLEFAKFEEKEPPTDEGWTDDFILSEIFAMQKDIAISRGDDPLSKLYNSIIGASLLESLNMNVGEKTKQYEEANEEPEEWHGSSGGGGGGGGGEGGDLEGGETSGGYDENKRNIEMIQEQIDELIGSEFVGMLPGGSSLLGAMDKYNKQTNSLNEDLKNNSDNSILAVGISERVTQIKKDVSDLEKELGKISAATPNQTMNPLRKLWISTTFLSLDDIVQAGVDVYEYFSRRHDRKKKDHAARLGMALFNGTNLGREARARQQKAEAEEVSEWQGRYENLDAWQLQDEIKSMAAGPDPSKDQLKAILRILAQKGRIDWRDENLWKVINKLQAAVHLTPGDSVLLHNPPLMNQKLHTALGEIYDYDEFTSLRRTNDSSYDSEMQKYLPNYDRMQDQLTDRLDQLLAQRRAGERVDPIEYESILEYSIKNGKSFAENIMFHLMVGISEGILTPDRGLALDKHLNAWPATQWIYSKSPPLSRADYTNYCKKYFNGAYEDGTIRGEHGNQFMNFYWTQIQNDPMTIERVIKSVSERGWDHDWTRSIACMGNAETAQRFLAGRSGQRETKATAVANSYVGAVQWLEENAKKPEAIDYRKHYTRMAGWIAMSEGIMDGTAYNRGNNDINTRSNASMEALKPREGDVSGPAHQGWVMRDYRQKTRSFLDMIDPVFFNIFRGQFARTEGQKTALAEQARDHLRTYYGANPKWENFQHVDDIYENMDYIIQIMMSERYMDNGRLKAIIAAQGAGA
ncbi:hypothetical protein KKA95_01975, partial [Patescibacteria group bacterium]|nr:hypothetical protein [Patescibacteria group bacterium]